MSIATAHSRHFTSDIWKASGVQETSPEGWQQFSPGWSASDTRGFSFNANRTPEGCEDNLDSSLTQEGVTRDDIPAFFRTHNEARIRTPPSVPASVN